MFASTKEKPSTITMPDGVLVQVRGLRKEYETIDQTVVAADGIDVDFSQGVSTAVTGPSGSGKSTLLHLIGALDSPDEGSIVVGGTDVTTLTGKALATYRRSVGFIFQRFHLIPTLTVLDNVIVPVIGGGGDKKKARARAKELLDYVGLGGRENTLATRLSGGQQQRVAIVRSLINEPTVIIADEPTGNLDSETSSEIEKLLLGLPGDQGTTVLVATHDPDFAKRCDVHVQVKDGRVETP